MTALALPMAPRGSMRDHDDLTQAVAAFTGTLPSLQALTVAALNCDMPADTADVVAWAERRAASYLRTIGRAYAEAGCAAYATARDIIDSVASSITNKAA